MFCKNCGKVLNQGDLFCANCGNQIIAENNEVENVSFTTNEFDNLNHQQSNNNQNIPVNNTNKEKSGLATASIVIGIISIILSFFLTILVYPLAIVGLILGIVNKKKCKKEILGIVLNSISFVIPIIILVFSITILSNKIPVSGTWNCKNFDGSGVGNEYIVTMKLHNDKSFAWNKYGDELNNHVYGTYTYVDEERTNASGMYSYYTVVLDGNEFVSGGKLQNEKYHSEYSMGLNKEAGELVIYNVHTLNMYYCFLED